ncbi:MAG: ABC transporter permease [Roseburia sp.]|nr:ABC transporter permease [Roseburia sp.]
MKVSMNPIVKKDLKVASRSIRLSLSLFAYEGVLVLALILALFIIENSVNSIYTTGNIYSYLMYIFPVLAISQVCIVALIVPIITASSISGEKERQTFDIMATTCISPFGIVLGKVTSAVLRILFFVAASIPVMALPFVVGGVKWSTLFYFLLTILLLSVFSGSIGILCSSFCRKSIMAVIMSFIIYFCIFGLTFLPLLLRAVGDASSAGDTLLPLLMNPIVFFEEFFMLVMTGESLLGRPWGEYAFNRSDVGFFTYHLCQGPVWMLASALCIFLLSLLFMIIAAWKINPLHTSSGRKRRKK